MKVELWTHQNVVSTVKQVRSNIFLLEENYHFINVKTNSQFYGNSHTTLRFKIDKFPTKN